MRRSFICLLLLIVTFWLGVTSVRAQDASPELVIETTSEVPSDIGTRPSQAAEINRLRQEYRQYLEAYREDDRQYQITNEQYLQLGTLVSLETAVTATRQAMISRNQVLVTYLKILQTQVQDATGVNLDNKALVLTRLEAMIAELTTFQAQVEASQDRNALMTTAADFELLAPQVEDIAYQTQTLLAAGRLQAVLDKATAIGSEVYLATSVSGSLRQAERDRAYAEIQTTLGQSRISINETNLRVGDSDQSFSRSSFTNALRDLGSAYAGLSQSLSYIQELLRI